MVIVIMLNPFSEKKPYKITGRIRDQDNLSVEGYTVLAFDRDLGVYFHTDDRLGKAKTDQDGSFLITFGPDAFIDWFESNPKVYLTIRDQNGKILFETSDKENSTRDADFQIKLGRSIIGPSEPDLYSGSIARIIGALKNIGDSADLSNSDTKILFELILRVVTSWTIEKDSLAQIHGYDAIQVPEHPRMEEHNHISRWDRPILPI
ncbi:MAG: carboxypeptidase-like regulatory domain-containing protein [Methanothrix sp.]|nr:carboxypeptidase-like regulatory domain-containing protein [Methanothrix sp.]